MDWKTSDFIGLCIFTLTAENICTSPFIWGIPGETYARSIRCHVITKVAPFRRVSGYTTNHNSTFRLNYLFFHNHSYIFFSFFIHFNLSNPYTPSYNVLQYLGHRDLTSNSFSLKIRFPVKFVFGRKQPSLQFFCSVIEISVTLFDRSMRR